MSTRTQIALISIIVLMAGLGFAATQLANFPSYQSARPIIAEQSSDVGSFSWVTPPGTVSGTSIFIPSNAMIQLYQQIENAKTTVTGFELRNGKTALLVSRGSARKVYELWIDFDIVHTFSASDCDELSLKKDGNDVILVINRTCGSYQYQFLSYYRYDDVGREVFAYEHEPWQNEAFMRNGYGGVQTPLELVSSSCKESSDDQLIATIKGIKIGDAVKPLSSTFGECIPADLGPAIYKPSFKFGDYDADFDVLTLILPNGNPILIEVSDRTVVPVKAKYSQTCLGGYNRALTYFTSTSTTVLSEDILTDPVLSAVAENNPDTCLYLLETKTNGNPVFDFVASGGETSATLGTFEFDLKTRKFKKVE